VPVDTPAPQPEIEALLRKLALTIADRDAIAISRESILADNISLIGQVRELRALLAEARGALARETAAAAPTPVSEGAALSTSLVSAVPAMKSAADARPPAPAAPAPAPAAAPAQTHRPSPRAPSARLASQDRYSSSPPPSSTPNAASSAAAAQRARASSAARMRSPLGASPRAASATRARDTGVPAAASPAPATAPTPAPATAPVPPAASPTAAPAGVGATAPSAARASSADSPSSPSAPTAVPLTRAQEVELSALRLQVDAQLRRLKFLRKRETELQSAYAAAASKDTPRRVFDAGAAGASAAFSGIQLHWQQVPYHFTAAAAIPIHL